MPQIALFASSERTLADDARGRIDYSPGFIDARTAARWFDLLRGEIAWKSGRRQMYDREVDVPRLTAHFRLDDAEPAPPAEIYDATDRVSSATGVSFNSVGLNFYRDGRDSVAPHNDHLHELFEGFPIALVSLGAPRRMTIRAKQPPRRVLHVDLEPGSLLLMSYATQRHYTHGIAKTAEPVGPRISLAFRVRRDAPARPSGLYR